MIYFIRSPDGPIKIGTTIRLSQRLKKLVAEYGEGIEVLAVTEGDRDVEQALHERFSHLRKVGEWFEPGDDLVGFIVSEARPWDGSDETDCVQAIRVEPDLKSMLEYIAARRGLTIAKLTSDLIRPVVEGEFAKVAPKIEKGGSK